MKFEKLKKNNIWKWIGVTVVISIVAFIVTYKGTKAKYRYTASFPAVQGTVHHKIGDLELLAINIKQEDGNYSSSNTIPTTGYVLNETESYCGLSNGDGTYTHEDITMNYHDGVMAFDNLTKKGTKCFLYFDSIPAKDIILATNITETTRKNGSFTGIYIDDTNGKIFEGPADDYGTTTYFFAGANPNNWLQFAGFWWRIVRINGDGSLRLIYAGSDTSKAPTETGEDTQIETNAFNANDHDNAYVGYMYGLTNQEGENAYVNTHKNINSSTIKKALDIWYNANLNKDGIKEHIDINAGFCGERGINIESEKWWSSDSKLGYGTNPTAYSPWGRLYYYNGSVDAWRPTQYPTLKCGLSNDLYTVKEANRGNKALTYPIGLITSDEIVFAGGFGGTNNTNYYLYSNQNYWTMSPYLMDTNGYTYVFVVNSDGRLYGSGVNAIWGIRPVINLKANTKLIGSGTISNPYVVN